MKTIYLGNIPEHPSVFEDSTNYRFNIDLDRFEYHIDYKLRSSYKDWENHIYQYKSSSPHYLLPFFRLHRLRYEHSL